MTGEELRLRLYLETMGSGVGESINSGGGHQNHQNLI